MHTIDDISNGQAGKSAGLGQAWDEAVRDSGAGRRGRVVAKARGSVAVAMAAAITLGGVPAVAFADAASAGETAKTQVVYVKASATGSQEGVYVVNQFESEDGSRVKTSDAGDYESVKNLTDDQQLSASGSSKFDVSADEPFLYQGDLASSTQLPWTVKVGYRLDGKTVSAEQLAGASGKLEMTLDIQSNSECEGAYADNFLLQVSSSFDNDLASSIEADGATLAQSAGNTQASYMVFPGKSGSYTIYADVHDFEFGGWTIVGVPLSIALDIDDDQFGDAAENLDALEQAIKDIDSGANSLKNGTASVASGSQSLSSGASTLASGASALASGAGSLQSGTSTLADGTESLSAGTKQLCAVIELLCAKLEELSAGGDLLIAGSNAYSNQLSAKASALSSQAASVDVASAQAAYQQAMRAYVGAYAGAFAQTYAQTGSQEAAQASAVQVTASQQAAVEQALSAFVTAQATKSGNEAAASALSDALEGYGQVDSGISDYVSAAQQIAQASTSLVDATGQVNDGAGSVASGASQLATGANSVASGAGSLSSGAGMLASGADTLASGAVTLDEGAATLADGTGQAAEKTDGLSRQMIDQVRDKLTDFLNPNFQLVDFVNGSDDVDAVQFVIKTDAIEIPDDQAEEQAAEPEKNFLEKLLALFGM